MNANTKWIHTIWVTIAIAAWYSPGAAADTAAGVYFPERIVTSGIPMELQGTGVKSVAFIKAFAAALYKEEGSDLDRGGKKIVVEYFVKIPGRKLNNFTVDSMRDNVSEKVMAELSDELEQMSELFVDLYPGDRFALAYIPGEGTQFLHNNQLRGVIPGETFARALYSVWIGDKPFDEKLKRSILGEEPGKRFIPFIAQSQ